MTLEEIKAKICGAFDRAWSELAGTSDVEHARAVVAATTSEVNGHVLAGEAALFNHVADNANEPTTELEPAAGEHPADAVPIQSGDTIPLPADGTPAVGETTAQA